MNLIIPISINLITLLILISGVIIGSRNGFKLELSKLVLILLSGVGCYFLSPTIENFITIDIPTTILKPTIFSILMLGCYLIISILLLIIKKLTSTKEIQGINSAKKVRLKGFDRKTTRRLRKEERKNRKLEREKKILGKKSKVFGSIFGFIIALIIGFIILLPYKPITNHIVEQKPQLEYINKNYHYTIYGQVDKLIKE
jgi:uncharacterized membrane protein required for colicin V production